MGRKPCCAKEGLNRGAWTALEDKILVSYIETHGEGQWRNLPKKAGLSRCGKSCRLRWFNYLRPGIKRGNISDDEEDLIIRLHKLLGNRWSLIAGRLPGRTDNEIKNYWNTTLGKKVHGEPTSKLKKPMAGLQTDEASTHKHTPHTTAIKTKAVRCTKVFLLHPEDIDLRPPQPIEWAPKESENTSETPQNDDSPNGSVRHEDCNFSLSIPSEDSPLFDGLHLENWMGSDCFVPDASFDLQSLATFLDVEEWI